VGQREISRKKEGRGGGEGISKSWSLLPPEGLEVEGNAKKTDGEPVVDIRGRRRGTKRRKVKMALLAG